MTFFLIRSTGRSGPSDIMRCDQTVRPHRGEPNFEYRTRNLGRYALHFVVPIGYPDTRFRIAGVMQESDDGVPRVHLPRLTYLAISFSKDATWKAPSVLTSFMQRTEMPSLNWITLYYDRFPKVDSEAPLSGMVESFAHVHIIYRLDQKDYLGKSLRSVFGELSSQVSSTNDSIRSNYPRCHKRRVLRTTFTGGCGESGLSQARST